LEEYSLSEHPQANPSQGSEAVQTKDELPVPLYIYELGRDHFEESFFQADSKGLSAGEARVVSDQQSHRSEGFEGLLG
jgi:hypothetical protein